MTANTKGQYPKNSRDILSLNISGAIALFIYAMNVRDVNIYSGGDVRWFCRIVPYCEILLFILSCRAVP
jgi:hypothetical protein